MRAIETIVVVVAMCAAVTVLLGWPHVPRRALLVGGIGSALLAGAQALIEGSRWQLVPSYVVGIVALGVLWWRSTRGSPPVRTRARRFARALGRYVAWPLAMVFATALPLLLPVFELPAPTGSRAVGVTRLHIVFEGRAERLTEDPNDARELMVHVWYPADASSPAPRAPYLTRREARAMARELGRLAGARLGISDPPDFFLDHLSLVVTHGRIDAPLTSGDERFPVVLFSHGYLSYAAQNTALMEELASRGYVVLAVAHTWDALTSAFPDGRQTGLGTHVTRWMQRLAASPTTRAWKRFLTEPLSTEERRAFLAESFEVVEEDLRNRRGPPFSHAEWVSDLRMLLDELARIDAGERPTRFAHRLDLERVAMSGMSFGGVVAAQVCHEDPRCRAAVNLDGMDSMAGPGLMGVDFGKPLLLLYSQHGQTAEAPTPDNPRNFLGHCDFSYGSEAGPGSGSPVVRVRVRGTSHLRLSDAGFFVGLPSALTGQTSNGRVAAITRDFVRSFLDLTFRGVPTRLLDGPVDAYPEVDFQSFANRCAEEGSTISTKLERMAKLGEAYDGVQQRRDDGRVPSACDDPTHCDPREQCRAMMGRGSGHRRAACPTGKSSTPQRGLGG